MSQEKALTDSSSPQKPMRAMRLTSWAPGESPLPASGERGIGQCYTWITRP
jgi:hypothetical protein